MGRSTWSLGLVGLSLLLRISALAQVQQTLIFQPVAGNGDDGNLTRVSAGSEWPPNGQIFVDIGPSFVTLDKSFVPTFTQYRIEDFLIRFNTAALPDNATIVSAEIDLYHYVNTINPADDNPNLSMVASWYDANNWPIDASDYVSDIVNPTALAPRSISLMQIDGIYYGMSLLNPGSVSRTGYTGLRFVIQKSTAPLGGNRVDFGGSSSGPSASAKLVVVFTVPNPSKPIIQYLSGPPVNTPTITRTFTPVPTGTITPTRTITPTATPTASPTITLTFTPTSAGASTSTPTASFTLTGTSTRTFTPSGTPTVTPTRTAFLSNKLIQVLPGSTRTNTPTFTTTPTRSFTQTPTPFGPTATPTNASISVTFRTGVCCTGKDGTNCEDTDSGAPGQQLRICVNETQCPNSPYTSCAGYSEWDGEVGVIGSPLYSPLSACNYSNFNGTIMANRRTRSNGFDVTTTRVRWDTSIIPDSATVLSASVTFNTGVVDTTSLRLFVAKYEPLYVPPPQCGQFVATFLADAFAVPMSALAPLSNNGIVLSAVSNINKTGYTSLQMGISDGSAPNEGNTVTIATYDSLNFEGPSLTVVYSNPAGAPTSTPLPTLSQTPGQSATVTPTFTIAPTPRVVKPVIQYLGPTVPPTSTITPTRTITPTSTSIITPTRTPTNTPILSRPRNAIVQYLLNPTPTVTETPTGILPDTPTPTVTKTPFLSNALIQYPFVPSQSPTETGTPTQPPTPLVTFTFTPTRTPIPPYCGPESTPMVVQ